jgi:hypothetical protein
MAKTGKGLKTHHGNTFTGPVGKLAVGSLATARGGLSVIHKNKNYYEKIVIYRLTGSNVWTIAFCLCRS